MKLPHDETLRRSRIRNRKFYAERRARGFIRAQFWAHVDDLEVLRQCADELRMQRAEQQTGPHTGLWPEL